MHPRFLDLPFGGRAVEPLEEFGKADHVHQLMGDNVEGEREKVNAGIPLDGSSNDVILEADLEIVTTFTPAQAFMGVLGVAVNLSERHVGDFLFLQGAEGLNVIPISFPL